MRVFKPCSERANAKIKPVPKKKCKMDAPYLFNNIDPSRISRNKAEETLLYVRYLLYREKEPLNIQAYENLKAMLEARLKTISDQDEVSEPDKETKNFSLEEASPE